MSALWWIPFVSGFLDAFNPCVFMTASVMIMVRLGLQARGLAADKFLGLFILICISVNLAFNVGFCAWVLTDPIFQNSVLYFYLFLSGVVLVSGLLLFYDWLVLFSAKSPGRLWSARLFGRMGNQLPTAGTCVLAGFAALVMSIAAAIWPPDSYITLISGNIADKHKAWGTFILLAAYTLVALWPVFVLAAALVFVKMTLRVQHLVYSAVFLAAGISVIYIF